MGTTIYLERLFSRWSTLILAVFTIGLFGMYLYQLLTGPLGTRPAPDWFFLAMLLLFVAVMLNFGWLNIRITEDGVTIGYGVFRRSVGWSDIEDCYPDEASAVRYGGWGIRIGWFKGKWRLVYNTLGEPRVVLRLRKGRFPELVFSTRDPEEVIGRIRQQLHQRG